MLGQRKAGVAEGVRGAPRSFCLLPSGEEAAGEERHWWEGRPPVVRRRMPDLESNGNLGVRLRLGSGDELQNKTK